ncbi:dTDP-4-dehydrorhamnose reductase [Fictibacillus fluitans]|uniref:dTDP-4-dehydrorhamnose reductase n=1 Tax=Fictibacillus fluitans TaxID=3058422 RepID=A0ABT8HZ59_9BACL|nr:dTDP-4-dehydrorhamnose reductase [Fictibacillus sp. NE201]MDN4526060.1 dTDP-4-dehydrorhamnose reductase [Fictibacillus sp. NE201]
MKIVVTGANGQVGCELVSLLQQEGKHEMFPFKRSELDVTDGEAVAEKIFRISPDWILHCAAYTNVEEAEDTGKLLNWKVNKEGAANIARAAAAIGAQLIFISTDYVFDGEYRGEYKPSDPANPLNEYGAAKLAGEKAVLKELPSAHIIRTSWVFGKHGKNFVYTMLKLAKKMDTLKVVDDQLGRPTYAVDLAAFMLYIMDQNIAGGIYHFANKGQATWYDFAQAILKDEQVRIIPVDSSQFVQKAARPKCSLLSLDKVKVTGFAIPSWQDALQRFLDTMEQ